MEEELNLIEALVWKQKLGLYSTVSLALKTVSCVRHVPVITRGRPRLVDEMNQSE